jgi:hypothetical protein
MDDIRARGRVRGFIFDFWRKCHTRLTVGLPDNQGGQLFGFKAKGFTTVREVFIPGNMKVFAFKTVYFLGFHDYLCIIILNKVQLLFKHESGK